MTFAPPNESELGSNLNAPQNMENGLREELHYLKIERDLAQLEKIKLLKDEKRNSWQFWLSIVTLLLVVVEVIILINQTKLLEGQNEIMGKQNEIMGNQTILFETQNILFGAQNELIEGQNSLMRGQNGLLGKQNELVTTQNDLLSIQNDRVTQQNLLIEAQRRSSYTFILDNLIAQINKELNDSISNPNRQLTEHTQNSIISISHFLTPYIFMEAEDMTNKAYSPERGLLLNFLLESQISTHELNYLLGTGNFKQLYVETLNFFLDTIYSFSISNSMVKDLLISNSRIDGLACLDCDIEEINFVSSQCSNINILSSDLKDNFKSFVSISSTLLSSSFSSQAIDYSYFSDCYFQDILLQAYKINSLNFINTTINNFSIISDTIGQINCRSSVFTGSNFINSTDDPLVSNSHKRSPNLVRDISKSTLISLLWSYNSILEHINSGTVIDTLILELSVLENAALPIKINKNYNLESDKTDDCFGFIFGHNSIIRGDILREYFIYNGVESSPNLSNSSLKQLIYLHDSSNTEKLLNLENIYRAKTYLTWNLFEAWRKVAPYNFLIDFPNQTITNNSNN